MIGGDTIILRSLRLRGIKFSLYLYCRILLSLRLS